MATGLPKTVRNCRVTDKAQYIRQTSRTTHNSIDALRCLKTAANCKDCSPSSHSLFSPIKQKIQKLKSTHHKIQNQLLSHYIGLFSRRCVLRMYSNLPGYPMVPLTFFNCTFYAAVILYSALFFFCTICWTFMIWLQSWYDLPGQHAKRRFYYLSTYDNNKPKTTHPFFLLWYIRSYNLTF